MSLVPRPCFEKQWKKRISSSTVASPHSALVRIAKRHPFLRHLISICQKLNIPIYRSEQHSRAVWCTACTRGCGLVFLQAFGLKLKHPLCIGSTREAVHLSLAGGPGNDALFPFHPCFQTWLLAKAWTPRETPRQSRGQESREVGFLF